MAEGPDRGISTLKGYRILVNKLPDPAALEHIQLGWTRADAPATAIPARPLR